MNRLIPILLTSILLFTAHCALSQGIWKYYTRADGLAGDWVYCINQDKSGNYWFGAHEAGLSKLDINGNWTNFMTTDSIVSVFDIEIDSLNNKWLLLSQHSGHYSGQYVVKFNDSTFVYYNATGEPLFNPPISLGQDSLGHIWCGTIEGGGTAYWFDGLNWHLFYVPGAGSGSMWWAAVNEIKTDRHGKLYFSHDQGISTLDRWIFYAYWTHDIDFDRLNRLWFGAHEYNWPLGMFDGQQWHAYSTGHGEADRVAVDSSNNIWMSFGNGASKFDGHKFTYFNHENGLSHDLVHNIYIDNKGDIWFATRGGISLLHDTTTTGVTQIAYRDNEVQSVSLLQNYPNPFNSITTINYYLVREDKIELSIYNVLGKKVINLIDERQQPGEYQAPWNGEDQQGREVSSGIYFAVLKYGNAKQSIKLGLIR